MGKATYLTVLEPRPLKGCERHLVGDHRRCPPGCKRAGYDDRPQGTYEEIAEERSNPLAHKFEELAKTGKFWTDDEIYAIRAGVVAEMRAEVKRAFPWLTLTY